MPTPSTRGQERLIRQWKLLAELSKHRRGLTANQMIERLELSKATLHRYLAQLTAAGVPIAKDGVNGEVRYVDPIVLRIVGDDVYFIAHDKQRDAYVPFKLDRISGVDVLADKAEAHPKLDVEALFAHSRKAWTSASSELIDIAVRLSPSVARYAHEYRFIDSQSVEDEPSGAVIVHARAAGIPEALRWVLSWGKEAEALEPPALRAAVAAEVQGAAARYEAPTLQRARIKLSHRS